MSAIPGSYRSLIDHTSTAQGQGVQRQRIGAQILWILMMILAPILCPFYIVAGLIYVCLIGGRVSATTKVAIFVLLVFFGISWIPAVSIYMYLSGIYSGGKGNQAAMVNGLTPICAYYLFTIWGIVVAFRRFQLTDTYEVETNRRDVASLKEIVIEPKPIPIPGAREALKAMKAAQAAKRSAFGTKHEPVPWYRKIFSSSSDTSSNPGDDHSSVPGLMQKESQTIIGDVNIPIPSSSHHLQGLNSAGPQNTSFAPPADDDGQEDTVVNISTVTDIANGFELYIHLKGKPRYLNVAAFSALTLAGATVIVVRRAANEDDRDGLWYLSTVFFCGMFLVFYSVFAFIIAMYLNQVLFIQRLTSAICGDQNSGIAWVRAHNLSHLRAWEAVRRLAVLEITNKNSVLNSLFTPSMFLSSLACLCIAAYLVFRVLFSKLDVGPFILTLLVLFVLLLSFIILVTGVANYAQSHLKLHTSIIAQKTYEIAKLIDEKYSDIERGLLVDTADMQSELASYTESEFSAASMGSRSRRNTSMPNWESRIQEEEDEIKSNQILIGNSSLADPDQARAQLSILMKERGRAMSRKISQQRKEEATTQDTSNIQPLVPRNVIQLPQYFRPTNGRVAVGFGAVDHKSIIAASAQAQLIQQQIPAPPIPVIPQSASRNRFEDDMSPGSLLAEEDEDSYDAFHKATERDAEGVEKLSISTLESCHASLLSLCNYFVANQPRPLILGMELQNVRYAIVFVLLVSGNLMFIALMIAFKQGKCKSE